MENVKSIIIVNNAIAMLFILQNTRRIAVVRN